MARLDMMQEGGEHTEIPCNRAQRYDRIADGLLKSALSRNGFLDENISYRIVIAMPTEPRMSGVRVCQLDQG